VGVPQHLAGARIDEVNEDLPAGLELPCRLEPVGQTDRVLPAIVAGPPDAGAEVPDGPAAPRRLRRPAGLRRRGRRRPRPWTGPALLVAARLQQEGGRDDARRGDK